MCGGDPEDGHATRFRVDLDLRERRRVRRRLAGLDAGDLDDLRVSVWAAACRFTTSATVAPGAAEPLIPDAAADHLQVFRPRGKQLRGVAEEALTRGLGGGLYRRPADERRPARERPEVGQVDVGIDGDAVRERDVLPGKTERLGGDLREGGS